MITCPKCQSAELATVEKIVGLCWITGVADDGAIQYSGETQMDWNSQRTITDAQGQALLHCGACNHEWYEKLDKGGTCQRSDNVQEPSVGLLANHRCRVL